MPLPSMVECSAAVARGVLENRDGIVVISAPGKRRGDRPQVALARALYADSNRHLPPTDRISQTAQEIAFEQAGLWHDLKTDWYEQYMRRVQSRVERAFNVSASESEGPPPATPPSAGQSGRGGEGEMTGIGLEQDAPTRATSTSSGNIGNQTMTKRMSGPGRLSPCAHVAARTGD